MIGAEDVDQVVEAAHPFVVVIGDVGGKVGFGAVLPHDDPVLLVAEVTGLEPGGAVLAIQHAALVEHGQRLVDAVVLDQAVFRVPAVEMHTEAGKVVFDVSTYRFERLPPDGVETFLAKQSPGFVDQGLDVGLFVARGFVRRHILEQGVCVNGCRGIDRNLGSDVTDIVATITGARKIELCLPALEPTQPDADAEYVHLASGIVDVILAIHREARGLEQVTDRGAVGGETAVADVQGAGRVCRHELEQHFGRLRGRLASVVLTLFEHTLELVVESTIDQVEIDETGPGNLDPIQQFRLGQLRDDGFRELARFTAGGLGEAHREVAGKIAVPRVAGTLDRGFEHQLAD